MSNIDISFDYYKIFYEVARCRNITMAADHLCLTQPTVTKYIQNLESALSCKLFERSKKGVTLTKEGQRLFRQIGHACQQMGQAHEVIQDYVNDQNGKINIGASELTMRYFLLPYLERFQHRFPNVKLQIHASSTPGTIESLLQEKIDFSLSITPLNGCDNLQVTPVSDFEDIIIAGNKFTHLMGKQLTLEEISTYPLISMEPGTTSRKFWDMIFDEHGLELAPNIEVNSNDLIPPAVLHNLGIGFVPFKFARYYLLNYGIIQLQLSIPIPKRQICVVLNPMHPLTAPAAALIEMLKSGEKDRMLSYSIDSGINY